MKQFRLLATLIVPLLWAAWPATDPAPAGDLFGVSFLQRERPPACRDASVEELAKQIDWLETHLETYGTIVPKHPDIWGEARLTKHRRQIEEELAKDMDSFRETLNASIRRSDQSFVGMAMTLGAALNETGTAPTANNATALITPTVTPPAAPDALPRGSFGPAMCEGKKLDTVSLEPTIVIQQKFRYLQLLNELRRINEGDDTADSPGYSLSVVRIPISVLPGKKTRRGYGAEITLTARPHLTPDLLPSTFRNLVINDIIHQLALPGRKLLDHPEVIDRLRQRLQQARQDLEAAERMGSGGNKSAAEAIDVAEQAIRQEAAAIFVNSLTGCLVAGRSTRPTAPLSSLEIADVYGYYRVLGQIALDGADALRFDPVNQNYPHLGDIEAFLRAELHTAYRFLSQPGTAPLWRHCSPDLVAAIRERRRCLCETADDRMRCPVPPLQPGQPGCTADIHQLRQAFFEEISRCFPGAAHTTTASLSWAIIVEAALLNAQLIDDVQRSAVQKGAGCPEMGPWPDFYSPHPSPAACEIFSGYVACRWPVHVFALDPATDEQNIGDVFSSRREMQLAAAVALAGGKISASSAFRFVRQLEMDMEVIALNRTAVAFAHGQDTFGWRFYPRVQTPPTRDNFHAFMETLTGGPSTDYLLSQRELEPGIREVAAVVLMPSFVPFVSLESRANWFQLTNVKHKELTLHDAMKISRTWQSVRMAGPAMCKAGCYRPEDLAWLVRAVEQIERKLPLQSMLLSIPYENTLGGFEMLNSGITDLAPTLSGWYGAPGISYADPPPACPAPPAKLPAEGEPRSACSGTVLFLVGDNFSVHDTKVIAGGRCVDFELMSRQIMRVAVPPSVNVLADDLGRAVVDVHAATPYGVSNHLLVPTVGAKRFAPPRAELIPAPSPQPPSGPPGQPTPAPAFQPLPPTGSASPPPPGR